jgi:hypothetical protein
MIFTQLAATTSDRFREIQRLFAHLESLKLEADAGDAVKGKILASLKGFFFVHLYGYLESSVSQGVQIFLQEISALNVSYAHCEQVFYSVVLDAEFKSATDKNSKNKKWSSRCDLLGRQLSVDACSPEDTIFADSLQSTGYKTLVEVFQTLNIAKLPVPNARHIGFVDEVKDRRHEVAHGRIAPEAVGGAFTIQELKERMDSMELVVRHILDVLEDHYLTRGFISAPHQLSYP